MATLFVDKLDPKSGTALEIGSSGDTITIPSGATITNSGTATGFPAGTPYCAVYRAGDQTISDATWTKIQFNTEIVDSAGAFDNSTNYRFTPQTSGYYYISAALKSDTGTNFTNLTVYLRKNGTEMLEVSAFNDAYNSTFGATIIQLNGSTDYVDVAANQNSGGAINLDGNSAGKKNFFTAFKLVG